MPLVRSTYNPVNERSDVHPQPLAPLTPFGPLTNLI